METRPEDKKWFQCLKCGKLFEAVEHLLFCDECVPEETK